MLRVLLLCLAIFAAAWLEFKIFPGHSYLEGDTRFYVPMLERLDAPGFLSRDLVATSSNLSFTAYDEATLFLHKAVHQPFRRALLEQQFLFRLAALIGTFLLARAAGLSDIFSLIVAQLVNLGASLAGPAVFLTEKEPLPGSFALPLVLLAMGLLTQNLPLLSAMAAGFAFLYDPVLALPFWCVLLVSFSCDRQMRSLVRPMLSIFAVFVLLLANLAQLQPGSPTQPLLTRISAPLSLFQRDYAPHLYVSSWPAGEIYQVLALSVLGLWAATRCAPLLNSCFRWLVLGTGLCGLFSIPISYLLIDVNRLSWAAQLQPARMLLFTAAACALLFGLAGMRAVLQRSPWEALSWFSLAFLLPASNGLFSALKQATLPHLGLALALACLLTGLSLRFATGWARFAMLAVPAMAMVAFARLPDSSGSARPSTKDLAAWAQSTWGSSVFLFPDAGRAAYPSTFRAESRHALWADWQSAQGVIYSESAAMRWRDRWQDTMQDGFSPNRLESLLPLPIDYYVLQKRNRLALVKPAFMNEDFVAYEAEDLRNTTKPLRLTSDLVSHK